MTHFIYAAAGFAIGALIAVAAYTEAHRAPDQP
jgi:hypothetical protein